MQDKWFLISCLVHNFWHKIWNDHNWPFWISMVYKFCIWELSEQPWKWRVSRYFSLDWIEVKYNCPFRYILFHQIKYTTLVLCMLYNLKHFSSPTQKVQVGFFSDENCLWVFVWINCRVSIKGRYLGYDGIRVGCFHLPLFKQIMTSKSVRKGSDWGSESKDIFFSRIFKLIHWCRYMF